MNTQQLLMISLLSVLLFEFIRKIIRLRQQFYPLYNQTLEYILKANRNNYDDCVHARIMVELARRCAWGRKRRIDCRQLQETWYFKFSHLLPVGYL